MQTQKRRVPFSLVIPPNLRKQLETKAAQGYRTLTKEILMRLEQSVRYDEEAQK